MKQEEVEQELENQDFSVPHLLNPRRRRWFLVGGNASKRDQTIKQAGILERAKSVTGLLSRIEL